MVSVRRIWKSLLVLFFINVFLFKPVFASTTDGTVSSGYAWSSRIGWINFAAINGNIHITDSALTGSAWNELYGWIKLNPNTSGVVNNGEGDLTGSAWGSNVGWIDFSEVSIGSDGIFHGTASGTNVGVVNFSCANCLVQTDWRPNSVRNASPAPSASAIPVAVSSSSASTASGSSGALPANTSSGDFSTNTFISSVSPSTREKKYNGQEKPLDFSATTSLKEENNDLEEKEKTFFPIKKLESYFTSSSAIKNTLSNSRPFKLIFFAIIPIIFLLLLYFYQKKDKR